MVASVLRLDQVLIPEDAPIRFGTDGWRGIIGAEFTFNRLLRAAKAAAAVLHQTYGKGTTPRIIVGYDRRAFSGTVCRSRCPITGEPRL